MSDLWDFRDAVNRTHLSALNPGLALRAARKVASESADAVECAELLDMLGLTAEMGKHEAKAA